MVWYIYWYDYDGLKGIQMSLYVYMWGLFEWVKRESSHSNGGAAHSNGLHYNKATILMVLYFVYAYTYISTSGCKMNSLVSFPKPGECYSLKEIVVDTIPLWDLNKT